MPDSITIGIVKERLAKADCCQGFILDGFPRTIDQADALDRTLVELGIKLDRVINITVPDGELVRRMTGRRVCKSCGATWHVTFHPPQNSDVCDKCGGMIHQRDDDKEETVVKRLTVYSAQTKPLIEYYQDKGLYTEIDGQQDIDDVFDDVVCSIRSTEV